MTAKLIRLRYAGTCVGCRNALPARTRAWWDADARSTTCVMCQPETDAAGHDPVVAAAVDPPATAHASLPLATGTAGASARQEYEKRHQRRERAIEQRWGRLAGIVKFLSDDPQSTTAWAKGSEGERRLAQHLRAAVGDRAFLLHDRKVPGTRGNIDHLAIAASGVWVIDAKQYKGRVEHRDVGGWFKTDHRLYVNSRDRTKLADALGWQVDAVRNALAGAAAPTTAALCFVDADWALFAKPFRHNGVWITWPKKLAELIAGPGPLSQDDVFELTNRLAANLPEAVSKT